MAQTNVQAFSGDVAISSNLAVDTNTLFVDSVGNKVGIGLTNPVYPLHISTTGDGDSVFNLVIDQRNNATVYYRKIAYVINNNGHAIIRGSMGSHGQSGGNGFIDVKFAIRDGFTALGSCYGTINNTNIIVKQNDDYSRRDIYLVTGSYSLANLQITTTHGCGIFGDSENQPTSTPPSGTTTHDLKEDFKTFRVDDDGNVGIGTTSPQGLLHISSGTTGDAHLILESDTNNNSNNEGGNPKIVFRQDGGFYTGEIGLISNKMAFRSKSTTTGNTGFIFYSNVSSVTSTTDINDLENTEVEVMRIQGDGNVGIGTNNPETTLQLHKEVGDDTLKSAAEIKFSTNNSGNTTWDVGSIRGAVNLNAGGSSNYPGGLVFATKSPGGAGDDLTDKMVIDANGNVGIGTDSPTSNLHVVGDVAISSNLAVDTNTLFVDSVGNKVGIGTTNPGSALHVVGDAEIIGKSYGFKLNTQLVEADKSSTDWYRLLKTGYRQGNTGFRTRCELLIIASGLHETVTFDVNYQIELTNAQGSMLNVYGHDTFLGRNAVVKFRLVETADGTFLDVQFNASVVALGRDWTVNLYVEGGTQAVAPTTFLQRITNYTGITDSRIYNIGSAAFLVQPSSNTAPFAITSSGSVGIGTTDPGSALDVVGDVGITGQMNITKSATYGRVMRLGVTGGGTGMGFYMGAGGGDNNWANTGIPLQTNNSGGGTILFMFNMNSSGNDSTSSQFWVLRKSYSTAWVQNSNNAYLIQHLNGGGGGTMTFQRSSNLLQYRNSGGGNGHFYAIECD